jgi:integrase
VRDIPMAAEVRAALQPIGVRSGWPRTGYVFVTQGGKPVHSRAIWAYFKRTMRSAGLVDENGTPVFRFHALRHAFQSVMYEAGVPLLDAAKIMGHTKQTMTLHYTHSFNDKDHARAAIESVSRALNPRPARQIPDMTREVTDIPDD